LWYAVPAKNPGVGALVQAQLWYRDPLNTSYRKTSFSDAIEFGVGL
jgi:predicted DNA-binding protein with PD1-like motif